MQSGPRAGKEARPDDALEAVVTHTPGYYYSFLSTLMIGFGVRQRLMWAVSNFRYVAALTGR